jgi:hypothetical protein
MEDDAVLNDLDRRIAAARENLRTLVEQAAAYSGAADETRISDRIAQMEDRLTELLRERTEYEQKSGS